MKKKKLQKITAQVKRRSRCAEKAKKRKKSQIKRTPEYVITWGPGPSKQIIYDLDGKVLDFKKLANNHVPQKNYTTNIGTQAMLDNAATNALKKELIKQILKKAGYDPTIRYTRKEKKRFTRAVKNGLFAKADSNKKYIFTYRIYRKYAENLMRTYSWFKDDLRAETKDEAFKELRKVALRYSHDDLFAGIDVTNLETDNSITYFPRKTLLAA